MKTKPDFSHVNIVQIQDVEKVKSCDFLSVMRDKVSLVGRDEKKS